jgi:hypothetical protein
MKITCEGLVVKEAKGAVPQDREKETLSGGSRYRVFDRQKCRLFSSRGHTSVAGARPSERARSRREMERARAIRHETATTLRMALATTSMRGHVRLPRNPVVVETRRAPRDERPAMDVSPTEGDRQASENGISGDGPGDPCEPEEAKNERLGRWSERRPWR